MKKSAKRILAKAEPTLSFLRMSEFCVYSKPHRIFGGFIKGEKSIFPGNFASHRKTRPALPATGQNISAQIIPPDTFLHAIAQNRNSNFSAEKLFINDRDFEDNKYALLVKIPKSAVFFGDTKLTNAKMFGMKQF